MRYFLTIFCVFLLSVASFNGGAQEAENHDGNDHHHDAEDYTTNKVYLEYALSPKGNINDLVYKEFDQELRDINDGDIYYPPLGVYFVDLNEDGVTEYIIRFMDDYMTCNNIGCHHAIIAVKDKEIRRLGYFEYSEIDISQEKTDGVKNLVLYDNALNDFSGQVLIWNDAKQIYMKNEMVND